MTNVTSNSQANPLTTDAANDCAYNTTDVFSSNNLHNKPFLAAIRAKFEEGSIPWQGIDYLGHMNYKVLPIALEGANIANFYNPNNVTNESSPVSSKMESENIENFCKAIGYNPDDATGSSLSGGTNANLQALYTARVLQQVKHALLVNPRLQTVTSQLTDIEKANLNHSTVKQLFSSLSKSEREKVIAAAKDQFVHSRGKIISPTSTHYSINSAASILGLPTSDVMQVQTDDKGGIDIVTLEQTLTHCIKNAVPIQALVLVLCTTETGAYDQINKVIELRDKLIAQYNIGFWLHVDAAFGGYLTTLVRDADGNLLPYQQVHKVFKEQEFLKALNFSKALYNAVCALKHCDSVIIDPHKMGYIQYGCGMLLYKDRLFASLIAKNAAYVFEGDSDLSHGVINIEGSRPGATAVAIHAASELLPLNITGYGQLIGKTCNAAKGLYDLMRAQPSIEVKGKWFDIQPVNNPEFNTLIWTVNERGSSSLRAQNALNKAIYDKTHYTGVGEKPIYYTSSTQLEINQTKALKNYINERGFTQQDCNTEQHLYVLRGITMNPNLANEQALNAFWQNLKSKISQVLRSVLTEQANNAA